MQRATHAARDAVGADVMSAGVACTDVACTGVAGARVTATDPTGWNVVVRVATVGAVATRSDQRADGAVSRIAGQFSSARRMLPGMSWDHFLNTSALTFR